MGGSRLYHRGAHIVVRYEQMARRFCIQDRNELVDIRPRGSNCARYCLDYGKLAKFSGSGCEPCRFVEG